MKKIALTFLALLIITTSISFADTVGNANTFGEDKQIEISKEDAINLKEMGLDPNDVILLEKRSKNSNSFTMLNKYDINNRSESNGQLTYVYVYKLKSEQISVFNGVSTRAVDPGDTGNYSYYYIRSMYKNHDPEMLFDSMSQSGFAT